MITNSAFLVVDKPKGWTSFDVVNKIRHLTKIKRVGHLGTLDPMATGVLIVALNKATKLFDLMQEKQKTYVATFEFGTLTDTLDATGEVLKKEDVDIALNQIENVLPKFIGKIKQVPPKYSAKSVGGVRAYDLARAGKDFELNAKEVEIYALNVLDFENNVLKLEICCGSGTYIRSLGRDLAENLGTIATMIELTRTKVGKFDLGNSIDIENLTAEQIETNLKSVSEVLGYPTLNLNEQETFKLLNGQTIEIQENDGYYLLEDDKTAQAVVKISKNMAKMAIFLG